MCWYFAGCFLCLWKLIFFYQGFLSQTLTIHRTAGLREGNHILFLFTTSTCSRTFRHLFATLHLRWLPCTFNLIACNYQTATQWDLPPQCFTLWLIDDAMFVSLCFTWWFDSRFLLQQCNTGNQWIWKRIDFHPCVTSEPTNQLR